jgi:hypothetical protein
MFMFMFMYSTMKKFFAVENKIELGICIVFFSSNNRKKPRVSRIRFTIRSGHGKNIAEKKSANFAGTGCAKYYIIKTFSNSLISCDEKIHETWPASKEQCHEIQSQKKLLIRRGFLNFSFFQLQRELALFS